MPAITRTISTATAAQLALLGGQIREQRKALRISATVAAEAAGMSRVTLHRIEKGEPSVTIGACINVMAALGLELTARPLGGPTALSTSDRKGWIPSRVRLSEYPQLRTIAWQVHGVDTVSPIEALSIYQRSWRHVDEASLSAHERELIDALREGLADSQDHV